jgi:hypothetical protein
MGRGWPFFGGNLHPAKNALQLCEAIRSGEGMHRAEIRRYAGIPAGISSFDFTHEQKVMIRTAKGISLTTFLQFHTRAKPLTHRPLKLQIFLNIFFFHFLFHKFSQEPNKVQIKISGSEEEKKERRKEETERTYLSRGRGRGRGCGLEQTQHAGFSTIS